MDFNFHISGELLNTRTFGVSLEGILKSQNSTKHKRNIIFPRKLLTVSIPLKLTTISQNSCRLQQCVTEYNCLLSINMFEYLGGKLLHVTATLAPLNTWLHIYEEYGK